MKIIILMLFFISNFSFAQDCKFDYNELDSFTHLKKSKTKKQVISVTTSKAIYVSFIKNDLTYLNFEYSSSGLESIVVGHNNTLSLLLTNDEIIDLYPSEVASGETDISNSTSIKTNYLISLEQIKKIRNVGLKKIRFNTTKKYYDFDIVKEKWISKLSNQIDCFFEEVK
jgi:hypothetical protein